MIIYVNKRYQNWAEWCLRGRSAGLGYPRRSNFMRLTPPSDPKTVPVIDEDAWEVEQVVQRLETDEQHLVRMFYLRTAVPVTQIARDLHCTEKTVYNKLERVHQKTLGYLNDLAAGVALPPVGQVRIRKLGTR